MECRHCPSRVSRCLLVFEFQGRYGSPTSSFLFVRLCRTATHSSCRDPDLLIWLPGGGHFQIELKAGTGKLSAHQSAWISRMTDMGVTVHVIRSLDALETLLRAEGVPPIGTLAVAISADVQEGAR